MGALLVQHAERILEQLTALDERWAGEVLCPSPNRVVLHTTWDGGPAPGVRVSDLIASPSERAFLLHESKVGRPAARRDQERLTRHEDAGSGWARRTAHQRERRISGNGATRGNENGSPTTRRGGSGATPRRDSASPTTLNAASGRTPRVVSAAGRVVPTTRRGGSGRTLTRGSAASGRTPGSGRVVPTTRSGGSGRTLKRGSGGGATRSAASGRTPGSANAGGGSECNDARPAGGVHVVRMQAMLLHMTLGDRAADTDPVVTQVYKSQTQPGHKPRQRRSNQ